MILLMWPFTLVAWRIKGINECDNPMISESALQNFLSTQAHYLKPCLPATEGKHTDEPAFSCAFAPPDEGTLHSSLWQCNGTNLRVSPRSGMEYQIATEFHVDALCPYGLSPTYASPQHLRSMDGKALQIAVNDGSRGGSDNRDASQWCTEGKDTEVLNGVTLVVDAYDFWNLYRSLHTLFSTFVSLRVLKQNVSQIVVLRKDSRQRQPMRSIWQKMFSNRLIFPANYGPTYCIKRAIFPFAPKISPLMAHRYTIATKECPVIPLMQQYADAFLGIYNITREDPTHNHQRKTHVVILSRADKAQRFRRIMKNIHQLADAVSRHDNGAFTVEIFAPSDYSVDEQVRKISHGVDIIIATHGASLTHLIGLPFCAAVVEFGVWDLWQFWNLAHMLGAARVIHKHITNLAWGDANYTANIPRALEALDDVQKERVACLDKLALKSNKSRPKILPDAGQGGAQLQFTSVESGQAKSSRSYFLYPEYDFVIFFLLCFVLFVCYVKIYGTRLSFLRVKSKYTQVKKYDDKYLEEL